VEKSVSNDPSSEKPGVNRTLTKKKAQAGNEDRGIHGKAEEIHHNERAAKDKNAVMSKQRT